MPSTPPNNSFKPTSHRGSSEIDSRTPERRLGGCQCGRIRYSAPAMAEALHVCHCTECQKQSSSAFGISWTIARESLAIVEGNPAFWSRTTASGHTLACAFCPECGSRLWHQSTGYPATLNIKAGSFDQPIDLSLATHIWISSKLPGVIIPSDAITFEREPE